jgi:enoyl-CoA hydratase
MEFLLTAEALPAERAYELGLLNELCAPEELMDRAFAWAGRILANGPLAVRATKESVIRGMEVTMKEAYKIESALSQMVFGTEDAKEGPAAFAEKRPPNWQNK